MSKRKFSHLSDDRPDVDNGSKFDNLPKEIAAEIMSYLPPLSLMRCKCLNKSWYFVIRCLIKDPKFVAKHCGRANASPTTLLICEPRRVKQRLQKSIPARRISSMLLTQFIDTGDGGRVHCVTEDISSLHSPHILNGKTGGHSFDVYHCNGVICLTKDSGTSFTLYNPALSEFKTFRPKTGRVVRDHGFDILGMGFGSDLGASNFKIVRLLDEIKAVVFSPHTTNCWREINFSIQNKLCVKLCNHVYFKGNCFWLAMGVRSTVLRFDVCGEVFHDIPLPNETCTSQIIFCSLTVRNDAPCFFCYPPGESMDMWLLEINSDGDCNYSWRKFLRIESCPEIRTLDILTPFAIWGSDELLVDNENGEKALYNLSTRKLRKLSVDGMLSLGEVFHLGPYVKSLVSVK